jgi:hypothetical protein
MQHRDKVWADGSRALVRANDLVGGVAICDGAFRFPQSTIDNLPSLLDPVQSRPASAGLEAMALLHRSPRPLFLIALDACPGWDIRCPGSCSAVVALALTTTHSPQPLPASPTPRPRPAACVWLRR